MRRSTRFRHLALVRVACVLLAYTGLEAEADAGQTGLTGWQEITILTVAKLEHASANCGFRMGWKQVSVLLESADLTIEAAHSRPRGADLQKQIDDDAAAYRTDRTRACAAAWAAFGADADARDFLLPNS